MVSHKQRTEEDVLARTRQKIGDLDELETNNLISLYLREGGGHELLERDEELELARMWQAARAARARLEEEGESLSEEERRTLIDVIERGDTARQRLIRTNLRLVVSIATRYRGYGVPFSDLIQEGNKGLMRAIDKFDPERGFRLSTYATWWIRHMVGRAIANQGRTIRLPVHISEKGRKVKKVSEQLAQEMDGEPTTEDIAQELDMAPEDVEQLRQYVQRPISFDQPVREEGEATIGNFLADERTQAPVTAVLDADLADDVGLGKTIEAGLILTELLARQAA